MSDYILALDQSTTSSKAKIVNKNGEVLAEKNLKHRQIYPRPGWVEHDPLEIYENVKKILRDILSKAGIAPFEISVLSITNQRETVLLWDKSGNPVYNAIVWQCRRTVETCQFLKSNGYENVIRDKTGLIIDPYFSATKIRWILDNVKGLQKRAEDGEILAGTIDSWLIYNLSGGKDHVCDFTNASRTMLFNIKELQWDEELLKIFNIPKFIMPQVKFSDEIFSLTKKGELFDVEIPISGVIGDSNGALFGQCCFESGMTKATFGTGTSVMMFTGGKLIQPTNGIIASVAWALENKVEYAIEGIIISTGDTLNWLIENLNLFRDYKEIDRLAERLADNEGVYLVPAFGSLGIPYWDMDARAAILGMTRNTGKEHIARAAIESVAYQVKDAVDTMSLVSSIIPKELRSDGGLIKSEVFMQFQSDILEIPVVKTYLDDLSLMGSSYIAGLAVGIWKSREDIVKLRTNGKKYFPKLSIDMKNRYYNGWKDSVQRVLTSYKKI